MYKKTLGMALIALSGMLVLAASPGVTYPVDELIGPEKNSGGEHARSLHFSISRGQFIFVGLNTVVKGKSSLEAGTIPLIYDHIRTNAVAHKWDLDVTVWPSKSDDEKTSWRIRPMLHATGPQGADVEHYDSTWKETPLRQVDVQSIMMEQKDISPSTRAEGIQIFEISYGKADGEDHQLIVAIADDPGKLQKAVPVSRTHVMFSWNEPSEYPIGQATSQPGTNRYMEGR